MIFVFFSTVRHNFTFSTGPPCFSLSLTGLTRITTLTLSFWAVVEIAAIDGRVGAFFLADWVTPFAGSKVEIISSSDRIEFRTDFFSLAGGLAYNRLSSGSDLS